MADEKMEKEVEETTEAKKPEEAAQASMTEETQEAGQTEEGTDSGAGKEPDEEAADVKEGEAEDSKKGFFKKKKDKKDAMIEDLTDKLKRQMAEFDNYRKRTEKEKSGMYEIGARSVIEKMLPVVDNFERGLEGATEEQKSDPFVEGMEKIYKQILGVFEELEVKPIEAVGQQFDPNLHNAVMHVEDEALGENTIAEEFQKGYMYRDTVVRHSMVKVAN